MEKSKETHTQRTKLDTQTENEKKKLDGQMRRADT